LLGPVVLQALLFDPSLSIPAFFIGRGSADVPAAPAVVMVGCAVGCVEFFYTMLTDLTVICVL